MFCILQVIKNCFVTWLRHFELIALGFFFEFTLPESRLILCEWTIDDGKGQVEKEEGTDEDQEAEE